MVEMDEGKKGKNRTQLLDGILHLLRSIRRLNPVGLVAQGEAGLACSAVAKPELRRAAYSSRRVVDKEKKALEETWSNLKALVLVSPGGYLVNKVWRRLCEYAHELPLPVKIPKHVGVILPERGALRREANLIAEFITGSGKQVTSAALPTPAYITVHSKPTDCPLPREELG